MNKIFRLLTVSSIMCLVSCPSGADPQTSSKSEKTSTNVFLTSPIPNKTDSSKTKSLTVHFYDVDQGLSALVDLPDGRHILIDTGDAPSRMGCGVVCSSSAKRLSESLKRDLADSPIDMLWITHQHSDHNGGVPAVASKFPVKFYVDNGRDVDKGGVSRARSSVITSGGKIVVVDPSHRTAPLTGDSSYSITAVLPQSWPSACATDANDCSIMLRIQFGSSSVLFTGDAESEEEKITSTAGPVTLLQVGHHGSNTSTSPEFLRNLSPKAAVISAGHPHEGLNRSYCHPRSSTVRALTSVLGGPGKNAIHSYDLEKCDDANDKAWVSVPSSDSLWITSRDGEVDLTTTGDGKFTRIYPKKE